MAKIDKKRLDVLVAERFPALTRNQIQGFIMTGKVAVDGVVTTKAGTQLSSDVVILLDQDQPKFVSRAGFKLEAALDAFGVDVAGLTVLDAGISTGGFTDCLLQRGAACVYGVDVGFGQVHERVANDPRLVLFEKTNLRHLKSLPKRVDLATLDLSFISLLKVLPAVKNLLTPTGRIISLIKPQFEADRQDIKRGGKVTEQAVHERVIEKIKEGFMREGFVFKALIESPITGATSQNKEFLALWERTESVDSGCVL